MNVDSADFHPIIVDAVVVQRKAMSGRESWNNQYSLSLVDAAPPRISRPDCGGSQGFHRDEVEND